MAKIQNPQNEKAETLATDNRVNEIAEQFLGVNSEIKDGLKNHKEELTSNNKSIHVDDADREKWDNAVQSVTRAVESSNLLSVTGETNAIISLSAEVASKADAATISSEAITSSLNGTADGTIGKAIAEAKKELNNTIVNKTVEINAKGNNITATLNENSDVPSYTISVDGYTTKDVDDLLNDKADKEEFDSHTSNTDIHITEEKREIWDTAATAIQTVKRADESSDLININQSGTSVSVALSDTVATKTDITNLENKITDKTVRINAEGDNITATLTETDTYTISVDGYTTSKVNELLNDKADKEEFSSHTSDTDFHVTEKDRETWNTAATALQEIIEGTHIDVNGNTVGVDTSSLVADTIFTTKVNELIEEELSIVEGSINDINNELETYNYSVAQSIETGTVKDKPDNTRGFGTLITNDITLGKVITYCHSTGGNENSNIWLKVFEKSTPHIFKGISDASLNHKHGATLEYTFKDSDIKLEAKKEYFFVFCSEEQKNSTTFQNSSDSIDCCIQTVDNTTGYGGVCGDIGISNENIIALHKIYKKPGKFAFATDLEEETEEIKNLIKNKVEALPSVYTGDNVFYTNCYGFEYTNPSENIIFDKIEIKFAKNLDTLSKYKPEPAPEITPVEVEDNICKIVVVKVKTPPPGVNTQPPVSAEREIATSSYNTNISNEVNLSQFKFSENILLESGWNYRFYFYGKNNELFPASVIINFIPYGGTTLRQSNVANRYISSRYEYDYWGTHGILQDNNTKVLNGLGIKLINSVQEHVNNEDIHVTVDDKNNWNTHVNNDIRHFKENEHEQLFSDEKLIFDSEKNVLDTGAGKYYGIRYIPSETFKFNKISIIRASDASVIGSKYLFIFKEEDNTKVFVQKCSTRPGSTIVNDVCTWEFEPTLLEKGGKYFIIFKDDESEIYSKSFVRLQALQQSSARESLYFIDDSDQEASTSYVPNIKIYGEGRLFAIIDELDAHTSNNIIHLTPEEKTTVISLKSTNINKLYNKTDNVATVSNKTITFSDGNTTEFEPENIISAQYAFRTTSFKGEDTNDDNAPNANSKLTAFNLRTIYTSTNGDITEGGRYGDISDGIELYKGNDGYYYYRSSNPVEYEQDLLWKDDEEYETLGNLVNGTGMFMRNKIEVFNDDLTCLTTAKGMFGTNRQLADFKSPLPSLVNAKSMFTGCRKLKNWRIKLPSLVIGTNMFSDVGYKMELQTVDTCLPNLTVARQMFAGCPNLTSFHVPSTSFSNLYDAREMFIGCPITSINGNFESLEDATNMLPNAHLDLASIQNIAKTIRNWSNGYPAGTNEDGSLKTIVPTISLGIGLHDVESDDNVIAIKAELDKIREKGWNVPVTWNGPAAVSTLDETNKTFFARLCDSGAFNTHIDENGKPCSIITTDSLMWISDKDSWSPMMSSLEEAETYFKLTKIEKVEE